MSEQWVEFAAAERGFENDTEWWKARGTAEFELTLNSAAGLDCYLIERTITVSDWRPCGDR